MEQHTNGLNREFKRDTSGDAPLTAVDAFDLEKVLSIEDIRSHTKTDDVPSVTDFMLKLYRKAAFEEAQAYTGLLVMGQLIITEDVNPPVFTYRGAQSNTFVHHTKYAVAQNFVWYYGLKQRRPDRIPVAVGSSDIKLPRQFDDFGMGCCNPCGSTSNSRIQYVAGYSCITEVPATLLLGALKFISHVIENPGDFVTVQGTSGGKRASGDIAAAANPAWASGAIEMWRTLKRDAI